MTTKQLSKLNMFIAVRNFVLSKEPIAGQIPNFISFFGILQTQISAIQSLSKLQGEDKTGITIDKNVLKKNLITITADNSRRITAYAKFAGNFTLLKEAQAYESKLSTVSGAALINFAQSVFDKATANLDKLADYGVTAETQKEFNNIIIAYNSALATPRNSRAAVRNITKMLNEAFTAADEAVKNMDYAVGIIKLKQPEFYNEYKTNRIIVDLNGGRLAMKVSTKDLGNGKPVKGVLFTFSSEGNEAGTGKIVKKTTEKGNFQIKSMPAGSYNVSVSREGYKEKELKVSVSEGQRTELQVELEKA